MLFHRVCTIIKLLCSFFNGKAVVGMIKFSSITCFRFNIKLPVSFMAHNILWKGMELVVYKNTFYPQRLPPITPLCIIPGKYSFYLHVHCENGALPCISFKKGGTHNNYASSRGLENLPCKLLWTGFSWQPFWCFCFVTWVVECCSQRAEVCHRPFVWGRLAASPCNRCLITKQGCSQLEVTQIPPQKSLKSWATPLQVEGLATAKTKSVDCRQLILKMLAYIQAFPIQGVLGMGED